jgi:hypothetical protein
MNELTEKLLIVMKINLNQERRISVKKLTNSDLSRTGKTHQTHIGLCDSSLTFRDRSNNRGRRKNKYSALLIHNDRLYVEPCEIKKITRKNGKRVCTKVSMGNRNEENLIKKIREIASRSERDFYMMWFASDNNIPVFMLFEEGSDDFYKFNDICDFSSIPTRKTMTFTAGDNAFSRIEAEIG